MPTCRNYKKKIRHLESKQHIRIIQTIKAKIKINTINYLKLFTNFKVFQSK